MNKGILFSGLIAMIAIPNITSATNLQKGTAPFVVSNYAKTKYPIVMTPGYFGFTSLGPNAFGLDYWYQILPDLARNGAVVYATQVSPVNSTEVRGEQLLQQIDEVIALTGQPKVNLIGHSHGGPTIQYVEGVAPDKLASMTAIAGAMKGTTVANSLKNNALLNITGKALLGYIIAPAIQIAEGNPTLPIDYDASVNSLTVEGAAQFNLKFPTAAIPSSCNGIGQKITSNGIYHYSWMGNQQVTNVLDLLDTPIELLTTVLMGNVGSHDGFVSTCSGNYGQVIRNDYNLNHFDEINQTLGIKSFFAPDPIGLFRQQANRLKLEGL